MTPQSTTPHPSAREERLLATSMATTIVFAVASIGFGLWLGSKSVTFDGFYDLIDAAMTAIAKRALERKTGARGLRSIIESVLLDTMYELPSLENVTKVVIDENMISGDAKPILMYADQPKQSKVSGSN